MSEIYPVVEAIVAETKMNTRAVCEVLNVSRAAYYAWRAADASPRETRDNALAPLVKEIFWRHRRRYGARRIAAELADRGERCSPRRVAKLLKKQGLSAIQPKSFVPKTTASRHTLGYSPNRLLDAPPPTAINQVWVGDISYVPLAGGQFLYLSLLLDLFSRRIVGWNLATSMTEADVSVSLLAAIRERQPAAGLIHHTDRGGQYAGTRYRAILHRAAMLDSMSRADNCYDNAFIESCFGTIKTELQMTEYEHQQQALQEIGEYIAYYNLERKHSALEYLTPHQFEIRQLKN